MDTFLSNKILAALLVLILAAGGAWLLLRPDNTQPPASTPPPSSTMQTTPSQTQKLATVSFNVKAVNFEFDTKELSVNEGDTVTINFESTSGFHDWKLDEFNAATKQVNPGTPTSVTFVADKAGVYEYYCSVGNHRAMGMVGKLTVVAKQ